MAFITNRDGVYYQDRTRQDLTDDIWTAFLFTKGKTQPVEEFDLFARCSVDAMDRARRIVHQCYSIKPDSIRVLHRVSRQDINSSRP